MGRAGAEAAARRRVAALVGDLERGVVLVTTFFFLAIAVVFAHKGTRIEWCSDSVTRWFFDSALSHYEAQELRSVLEGINIGRLRKPVDTCAR